MQWNIYLVRHGQTYYNIMRKMQGWSNSPLTKEGYQDATNVGQRLAKIQFAAAFCSDMTRAIETTQIILKENQSDSVRAPTISRDLRDCFYGSCEGTNIEQTWFMAGAPHGYSTFKEIVSNYSIDQAKDWLHQADPFRLSETSHQYWQRINRGIQQMRDTNLSNNANILWVSHGMTCLSLAERFGKGKYDVTKRPANGSVSKLILTVRDLSFEYYDK